MSTAERETPVTERPTVPAPASEAEASFEEEIKRLGGSWSGKFRMAKPIKKGGQP